MPELLRWRRRLTRTVDLLTASPTYRRLRPARDIARSPQLPESRDEAIGFVAEYCTQRGLCYSGTIDFLVRVFEQKREDLLIVLAFGSQVALSTRVAEDPSLPEEAARVLSRSPSADVRAHLAGNQAIPNDVLGPLLADPDPTVRQRAGWNQWVRTQPQGSDPRPGVGELARPERTG